MTPSVPQSPGISIVMPLYNKESEVGRAIVSVLAQSVSDYELIVVDDGSSDNGPRVVASIFEPRLRMVHQDNAGASAARNRGISEARAGLVAFLDADDEWAPGFLETIFRLVDRFSECQVYATGYGIARAGRPARPATLRGLPTGFSEGILDDYFRVAAHSDPPLCSSAVAVQKAAIQAVGGFPVGVTSGEDLLTWARLAVRFSMAYSTYQGATFWRPENVNARPGRFVSHVEDKVGKELDALFETASPAQQAGIRCYLGRWHEMRAAIALQRNRRRDCLNEVGRILTHVRPRGKHALLVLLACLPGGLPARAYQMVTEFYATHSRGGTLSGAP